jgi:hypothetical protein
MPWLLLIVALLLAAPCSVRAEPAAPAIGEPSQSSRLWLEPGLWIGPYVWHTSTVYEARGYPEEPNEHSQSDCTMVGGALGVAVGAWFGEHIAFGGGLRAGGMCRIRASKFSDGQTNSFVTFTANVVIAQRRHRGLRLTIGGGLAVLFYGGAPLVEQFIDAALGTAASVELGYALPVGGHAFVLGLAGDLIAGFSSSDGDHGTYKNRELLFMPGLSLRFTL